MTRTKREGLRIVLLGEIGRLPFAGMAWEMLFYLEGFRRLGHDVFYVEDSGHWPYYATGDTTTEEACAETAGHLARVMAWAGMSDRWAYRAAAQDGRIYGLSERRFKELWQTGDVLVNLPGSTWLREEHMRIPVRVYLQTDPVLSEIEAAQGDPDTLQMLGEHTHHVIFAENLGGPDCGLPPQPVSYQTSRNPIVIEWFTPRMPAALDWQGHTPLRFTTVANWDQSHLGRDVEWNGEVYAWSKHFEFLKFLDLPRQLGLPLELALASITARDREMLETNGWRVVDAEPLTREILPYRDYIWGSDAEFTVAKDQNIRLRTGWFSDRSAEYLAAGRPVITQDTAFGTVLPTGEGLFSFNSMAEILDAVDAIRSDYRRQSQAAREIAEEYFRAEKVLAHLLDGLVPVTSGPMAATQMGG